MNTSSKATADLPQQAGRAWEVVARVAYAVSGLLHVLVGVAIIRIARGSGAEADQKAALGQIGGTALGAVVLWVAVLAFLALGAWQAVDAFNTGAEKSDRVKSAGKAALYVSLAVTSASVALGSQSSSGDESAQGLAAGLMHAPAGRVLVAVVGLGILAGGAYHVVKGSKKKFLEDLRATPGGELGRGLRRHRGPRGAQRAQVVGGAQLGVDLGSITIPRERLVRTQTPHTYHLGDLLRAHDEAEEKHVENTVASCTLMAALGVEDQHLVIGSEKNGLKLTQTEDVELFKALIHTSKEAWLK